MVDGDMGTAPGREPKSVSTRGNSSSWPSGGHCPVFRQAENAELWEISLYKGTAQNLQVRLDRKTVRDASVSGGEPAFISDAEARQNFRRAIAELEHKICSLPKGSSERNRLAKRKTQLQKQREAQRAVGRAGSVANPVRIFQIFKSRMIEKYGVGATTVWIEAVIQEKDERENNQINDNVLGVET